MRLPKLTLILYKQYRQYLEQYVSIGPSRIPITPK